METTSPASQDPQERPRAATGPLSRRSLLKVGGVALGGAVLAPALAACGSSGGTGSSGSAGTSGGASTAGGGAPSASAGAAASSGGSSGGGKKGKVTVWWNSGFYDSENQAVQAVAADFEKQSGYTVDLQFYSTKDIPTKEQSAITAGVLPDVVMAENGNTATYAYQGHLADVSSVMQSQEFTDGAKKACTLYNSKTGKSGVFAVAINQFTVPMFYWKDMLEAAGSDPASIPKDWSGFWKFFEDAQGAYRSKTGKKAFAVGWPMSTSAGDTHYDTQMALMSFDAMVLDGEGHLQAAKVKGQIVKALSFLADLYTGGFTPKDVVNWDDNGNNTAFSNKTVILTPNGSLSIPGAVKDKDKKAWDNIVTQPFPDKPDSSGPVPSLSQVHNAVVFDKSPNKQGGIDFLTYFVQPANTLKYLKGGHGRWHPAQTKVLADPYFAKSDDPNIATATKMLTGPTQPAWLNISVAYNHAELQGMWGTALGMIILQGKSASDAADYAIGQLTDSFNNFPVK